MSTSTTESFGQSNNLLSGKSVRRLAFTPVGIKRNIQVSMRFVELSLVLNLINAWKPCAE